MSLSRTLRIQVSDELLKSLDGTARRLGTSRSELARQTLSKALDRPDEAFLERQHRQGYTKKPAGRDEFRAWHAEQVWPE